MSWVDDVALAITTDAETVVAHTSHLLSIVMDVTLEHGLQMLYGQGKTAVILDFRGTGAQACRQRCEMDHGGSLLVLSEHGGANSVPMVSHYKHLGGHIVRGGTQLPEIQIRGAATQQNVAPLKKILADQSIPVQHRQLLVKSMGLSVLKLHAGTWFSMNRSEIHAWSANVFRLYQLMEGRDENGEVVHKKLYQLAGQLRAPMPVELIYLERLRVFIQVLQCFDKGVITAILYNHRVAGGDSWLHGLQKSLEWAQTQIGRELLPDEILCFDSWQSWYDFRDAAGEIKKRLQQVEKAHVLRIRTYNNLSEHHDFQSAICQEMGWELEVEEQVELPREARCDICQKCFPTQSALAAHQQRKHHQRMAIRRFVKDGVCRACTKQFHSRCRLLRHLQWSRTNCWIFHMRSFKPMTVEEAQRLDDQDRSDGNTMHQKGLKNAVVEHAARPAYETEIVPKLEVQEWDGDPFQPPSSEEIGAWSEWGLLPPGMGGRNKTTRKTNEWTLHNLGEGSP